MQSFLRFYNMASPVSDVLSTFISLDSIILTSAGILSPLDMITISPGTNFVASINTLAPPLMT